MFLTGRSMARSFPRGVTSPKERSNIRARRGRNELPGRIDDLRRPGLVADLAMRAAVLGDDLPPEADRRLVAGQRRDLPPAAEAVEEGAGCAAADLPPAVGAQHE